MDGWLHYLSVDPKDAPKSDDVAAFTDPDGKVTVMFSVFERVIDNDEPGLLAGTLHHEAVHYADLIRTGWDTHEQMEIRADQASLAMVDVFMPRLSPKIRGEVKDGLRKRIADAEALVGSGNTRSPFPNTDQEKRFEEAFRRQESRELEYHDLVRRVERLRRDRRDRPRIGDVARCQERMIRMIRDLPAPVNADWMMDRIEYERRGGRAGEIISGVIESVRRAVADGTAALARAASPGAATRGPGEPVRDPGGGDRGSRLPGGENPPLDRLRGINAGDSW